MSNLGKGLTPESAGCDNPNEIFDIVDEDDIVIGKATRGECHVNPLLYHRSVQILIFNSEQQIFLQKRSRYKDTYPGAYCASASGHVVSGDSYEATAYRELQEELGITIDLHFIGKSLIKTPQETEWSSVYVGEYDGDFKLHPEEIDGGVSLNLQDIETKISNGEIEITPAFAKALEILQTSGMTS